MVFNFTESESDQQRSIQQGVELLSTPGIAAEWQRRRDQRRIPNSRLAIGSGNSGESRLGVDAQTIGR